MNNRIVAQWLSAVLLVVLASTLTAQQALTSQIVVTVVDQAGAVIPGARIEIADLSTAAQKPLTYTRASGEATVTLAKGSYAIAITAEGFARRVDRLEVRDGPTQTILATLRVNAYGGVCSPCVGPSLPEIPIEHPSLDVSIRLEPLPTITVPGTRIRRRWLRL